MRRITTLALTALLLAGCAPAVGGRAPIGTPPPNTVGPDLRTRAAQVALAWSGSAAEQAWSSGYHPLTAPQEWLPADAFRNGGKAAYLSGAIEAATELPPAEPTAEVVWPYGQRLALPMVSPRQVLDGLTRGKTPCTSGCEPPLEITAVAHGSRTVATSRGPATVPVWEFTLTGYQEPFAYPAVAPQRLPVPDPDPRWADRSVAYDGVRPDGLTVIGLIRRDRCDEVVGTEAYETDRLVVLMVDLARTERPCDPALIEDHVTVKLARPLDARLVLDLATGVPRPSR